MITTEVCPAIPTEPVNINARNGEIMNFGVLNDYSEPAADRFPVQVLKQQANLRFLQQGSWSFHGNIIKVGVRSS
jgi:hypothetical protein